MQSTIPDHRHTPMTLSQSIFTLQHTCTQSSSRGITVDTSTSTRTHKMPCSAYTQPKSTTQPSTTLRLGGTIWGTSQLKITKRSSLTPQSTRQFFVATYTLSSQPTFITQVFIAADIFCSKHVPIAAYLQLPTQQQSRLTLIAVGTIQYKAIGTRHWTNSKRD